MSGPRYYCVRNQGAVKTILAGEKLAHPFLEGADIVIEDHRGNQTHEFTAIFHPLERMAL